MTGYIDVEVDLGDHRDRVIEYAMDHMTGDEIMEMITPTLIDEYLASGKEGSRTLALIESIRKSLDNYESGVIAANELIGSSLIKLYQFIRKENIND